MIKPFEIEYLFARPFLPPLHRQVHRIVRHEIARRTGPKEILDVGGRKSHYTIGLAASVTITDVVRSTLVQKTLNLGITDDIQAQILRRRSNVARVIYDDMTKSSLPDASYDIILAVEVLEHVEEDETFIRQIYRVLKPGGFYVMTTPNGDFVNNTNPDHKRHYQRAQLEFLLKSFFGEVSVWYGIKGGHFRRMGLKSWSLKRPFQTALSAFGNIANALESRGTHLQRRPHGTHHLFATARKQEEV